MAKKKTYNAESQRTKTAIRGRLSTDEGWSARRAKLAAPEKIDMARHFAMHDLFAMENESSRDDKKITTAKIIVNPGTTPNVVVKEVLAWVKNVAGKKSNSTAVPYITWYTPGTLVPATLFKFKVDYPGLRDAAELYLFPGIVDPNLEMVRGQEAVGFIRQLNMSFTYALLSAYALDMTTGDVFFFFDDEVDLQQAIGLKKARQKFLFVDPAKFKWEGSKAYSLKDLLKTSQTVTIYTTTSQKDPIIKEQFKNLATSLLDINDEKGPHLKTLRLLIVIGEKQINIPIQGALRAGMD